MPELPEVETIKLGLNRLITGKNISSVDYDWPKSFPNSETDVNRFLIGAKVISVNRRGKALIIELNNGYSLVVHLKMTGQLVFVGNNARFGAGHPSDSLIGQLPDKSTRVCIVFSDDSKLFFNDQRKFGWMRLYPSNHINEIDFFKKLGPDPLDKTFDWRGFKIRLSTRPNTAIKPAIMDQSVIAGVGNIYADESLWYAKINPSIRSKDLSDQEIEALLLAIQTVLKLSIENGGSTDRNYVDAEGKRGNYLTFAKVFRRQGLPCPRCSTLICKTRLSGRGTHFCPKCQALKGIS